MNIQQSINAMLGTTAIVARINPYFEAKTEDRIAERYINASSTGRTWDKMTPAEASAEAQYMETASKHAERAYTLGPSEERKEVMETLTPIAYEFQEQASEVARRSSESAQKQKREQQKSRELVSIITSGGQGIEEWKRKYGGEA